MLLLSHFGHCYLIYTFHDLMKTNLPMMVTFIYGMTWYLELIHKLLSDIEV